ncbi:YkyA family protein [Lederbergia sp. NSJ-179]|uniref:YkyA family protein n=1 Tax=Lederbergia sp. NSJ-179 TaxID=2931402 RepID=UPI001FD0B080|nr:YkyA family protein [Lederbergia sp. NSJ-179]MCJ7840783.1 YkyA family protein [Lederbergia sp. NSJ-179]
MKLFQKLLALGLLIVSIIFICTFYIHHQDQKRIENITRLLEKSAQIEKTFASNQQGLSAASQEEKKLYDKIISYQVDNNQEIRESVQAVLNSIEKQQQYLEESKQNFSEAYHTLSTIQPFIQKVRDPKQVKATSSMVQLNEQRYQLYLDYAKDYAAAIALNKELYQQIGKEQFNEQELDQQVEKINRLYQKLHKKKDQFNRYTSQFNQKKEQYYRLAKLI